MNGVVLFVSAAAALERIHACYAPSAYLQKYYQ
jgi:hypothetical protein